MTFPWAATALGKSAVSGLNVISGHARTFGALRRKELERDPDCQIWEMPNGDLIVFPPGQEPILQRIEFDGNMRWSDED